MDEILLHNFSLPPLRKFMKELYNQLEFDLLWN